MHKMELPKPSPERTLPIPERQPRAGCAKRLAMVWNRDIPVVLASGSPRRKELLRDLIPEFEIVVSDIDEDALTVPDPYQTAEGLALAKARAVAKLRPEALVIGGDTVVALPTDDGQFVQFAKPESKTHACEMVRALSGKTHRVITGLALVSVGHEVVVSDTTHVTFCELSDVEIEAYVETGIPMDKAGAYAIQQGAESFVERVEGSVSNVIGLPMERLSESLEFLMTKFSRG